MKAAYKAAAKQYAAFKRRLAQATIQDIFGVVGASGSSCAGEAPDCSLVFHCPAWRVKGTPVRTDKLRVELPASERRAQELRKAVTAYSIVHFRGRIAETLRGSMAAEAVRIVATSVVDSELETHAGKLRQPVILRDDVLGTFALDRSLNWFNGKCAWNGKEVKLTLAMEDDDTSHAKELVSTAHALMRSGRLWSERITKYIAGNLLPLYNTSWRQHDAPVLTASAFLPQLRLRAIIVSGGGRFEFEFGVDGELFGGHAAAIRGSLTKGVQDFELQG